MNNRSPEPPSAHPPIPPSADLPRSGRLLGIDWGEKRIGLAISDPTQTLAQPLDTLIRRAGRRFPMRALRDHIDAHQPVGIVIGLPLDPDGSEGVSARAARDMGDQITTTTQLPAVYVDERMSTALVKQTVAELGGKTGGRETELDQLAATLVLQSYLDRRRT